MSKSTSIDLFELIKSLTKSEKGYFKKFGSYPQAFVSNLIFDAIDKQVTYDENKILQTQKNRKQFPYMKNYLYNNILQCLRIFYANKSSTFQIRELLDKAEILKKKGLSIHSDKVLQRAKKIATVNEDLIYLLEISTLEYASLNKNIKNRNVVSENCKRMELYQQEIFKKINNEQQYKNLSDTIRVFTIAEGDIMRSASQRKAFENIGSFYLLRDEKNALTTRAKLFHFNCLGGYCNFIQDQELAFKTSLKTLALYDMHPGLQVVYFYGYLLAINNFIATGLSILSFENLVEAAKRYKQLIVKNANRRREIEIRYYSNLLSIVIAKGLQIKHFEYFIEIERWLRNDNALAILRENRINNNLLNYLFFELSYYYFINGDYKRALIWIKSLLRNEESFEINIFFQVKFLHLLIHYEMGNEDRSSFLLKYLFNYLDKNERPLKIERVILNSFADLIETKGKKKAHLLAMKQFLKAIREIVKSKLDIQVIKGLDLESWLVSKVENRPFWEVLSLKK